MWTESDVEDALLDCGKWKAEKKELRATVTDRSRWGYMPYPLGRQSGWKDRAPS